MKFIHKLKYRCRCRIIELVVAVGFIVPQFAMAAANDWSCGAWVTDATNSCVETKTCTRTICDSKGKLDNCRTETKTSTATKANCPPVNGKPVSGRFTKGTASAGTMALPPSGSSVRVKPVTSGSSKSQQAVTKKTQLSKPGKIVTLPTNQNTPMIKQAIPTGVPMERPGKPQNKKLVAVPIVNGKSGILSPNKSAARPATRQKPAVKSFVPIMVTPTPNMNLQKEQKVNRSNGFIPVQNIRSGSNKNTPAKSGGESKRGFVEPDGQASKASGSGFVSNDSLTRMKVKNNSFQKLKQKKKQVLMLEQGSIKKGSKALDGRIGTRIGGKDCNDARHDANPNGIEVCDGIDNDCDGYIDEGTTLPYYLDADGDAHGDVLTRLNVCPADVSRAADEGQWLVPTGNDCDDSDPERWNNCN